MKKFNEKHEAIIYSTERPCVFENLKTGDVVEHFNKVDYVKIYQRYKDSFVEVYLSRDMIIDLYNNINEIELEKFNTQYFDFY